MKRKTLLISAVLILLILAVVISSRPGKDPEAPRFVPGNPASIGPIKQDHYNWGADTPFEGGQIWLWTVGATNIHSYLYDLDRRVMLGELVGASIPELRSRDGSRLLVRGSGSPATWLKRKAVGVINAVRRIFGAPPLPPGKRIESFWILNVTNNSSTRWTELTQAPGAGSGWHPSPDFRHGYTRPSADYSFVFVCDLETGSFTRIPVRMRNGDLGWWDDRHILIESAVNQFDLLDIKTLGTRTLFGPADIAAVLASYGLTNDPAGLWAFPNWNGRDYDFYFGIKNRIEGLGIPDGFLLKADRAGPTLKLMYRHFEFHWGGTLDRTATRFLYSGEAGAPGNGGDGSVHLRDLTNETTTLLVPPNFKGQYSIPRFYGNEVIYFRERMLRRVGLDGSNDTPVLPAR